MTYQSAAAMRHLEQGAVKGHSEPYVKPSKLPPNLYPPTSLTGKVKVKEEKLPKDMQFAPHKNPFLGGEDRARRIKEVE